MVAPVSRKWSAHPVVFANVKCAENYCRRPVFQTKGEEWVKFLLSRLLHLEEPGSTAARPPNLAVYFF
jgi:hypothetical protein